MTSPISSSGRDVVFPECGHKFSGRRLTERVDDASCRFVDDCPVLGDDAIEQSDLGEHSQEVVDLSASYQYEPAARGPHAFERGHGRRFHAAMVSNRPIVVGRKRDVSHEQPPSPAARFAPGLL